jgi:hypothetical protein
MKLHANWIDDSLLIWNDADDVPADDVRDQIGEITSDGLLGSVAQQRQIDLWLPQDGQLIRARRNAMRLSPSEAVDFLVSLPQPLPARCGESIDYWRTLAMFVLDRISRQLFFPNAVRVNNHIEASWRILIATREQTQRVEEFAEAMPPSCLAMAGSSPFEALETPPTH